MDGKGSRGFSSGDERQRQHNFVRIGRKYSKFLATHKQSLLAGILFISLVVLLFGVFSRFQSPTIDTTPSGVTVVDYSTLVAQVRSGNVLAVTIRGNEVTGLLARPVQQSQAGLSTQATMTPNQRAAEFAAWSRYVGAGSTWANTPVTNSIDPSQLAYTHMPNGGDAEFTSLLLSNHVVVSTLPPAQSPLWLSILWRLAPFVFLALILTLLLTPRNNGRSMRSIDERVSKFGKSQARRFGVKEVREPQRTPANSPRVSKPVTPSTATVRKPLEPPVTFADVAGIDEVRQELEEIVQFLRNPERYDRLGARIPHGALLVGPPGTGKTLLAKAVAGEAGVPFFSMSASEFVEMFVGVGASRVRDLFDQAKKEAPAIIFIDELDALGRSRAAASMPGGGHDEREQTLNQVLTEMDGFTGNEGVIVLAATNRPEILDAALLRAGRFDRRIAVNPPDQKGRAEILRVHTRSVPLAKDVDLAAIAAATPGMVGADLHNLANEAALLAAHRGRKRDHRDDFTDALEKIVLGAARHILISPEERERTAYHEAGHALLGMLEPGADPVRKISIMPRGRALGVTFQSPEQDRYGFDEGYLRGRMTGLLGGRAAEELVYGAVTTGAESDL